MKRLCPIDRILQLRTLVKIGWSFVLERSWVPLWHVPTVSCPCWGPVLSLIWALGQRGGLREKIKVVLTSPLCDCLPCWPLSECGWKNVFTAVTCLWAVRLFCPAQGHLPVSSPFLSQPKRLCYQYKKIYSHSISSVSPLPCLGSQPCLPLTPYPRQPQSGGFSSMCWKLLASRSPTARKRRW